MYNSMTLQIELKRFMHILSERRHSCNRTVRKTLQVLVIFFAARINKALLSDDIYLWVVTWPYIPLGSVAPRTRIEQIVVIEPKRREFLFGRKVFDMISPITSTVSIEIITVSATMSKVFC